mgnify:FL=1
MQRIPVTSSDLSSVGYDSGSQTLEIQFNSGGVYQYFNVPSTVYEGLMSAPSHGKYFHAYIKNSYSWQKL